MRDAFIIGALRTPVCPRNGALKAISVADLGAAVIGPLLASAGFAPDEVDEGLAGNALYGGGNPARNILLAAGVPERAPALTIDTQCCAGLDAILLAASLVQAGAADLIVAGGAESFSRSPLRFRRPSAPGEAPEEYLRPPFSPWPERDPDLIEAAAAFGRRRGYTRAAQEAFACDSHRKALAADLASELTSLAGAGRDTFARPLDPGFCARMPPLAGTGELTAALVAVEADAAAFVMVASERFARKAGAAHVCRVVAGARAGCAPEMPMTGAQAAVACVAPQARRALVVAEIMEAFACQAMAAVEDLALPPHIVNRGGGALSRGHPIGASGAILAVRLFHELGAEAPLSTGVAAIAAAGGLGSAMLLERV